MTALTANELETIRSQPKISELNLSIFQPRSIMSCQVNNGSIANGAMIIAYDTVSLGGYASVEAGMTLLVGTSAGNDDVGRVRIRSVTSSQFVVAENSLSWEDDLYLTVLRYWEVWPVYPRIINDPTDAENVIFYKDYDIAYTDQNEKYGAFACAGPHRAAYIDESTGKAKIYWSSEDTYPIKGTVTAYDWEFEGGFPTGSTSASPGYIEYPTPGHYVTRLKVNTSLGIIDTTYRYVSIYHKPGYGSSIPPQKWQVQNLGGSRGEGGYSFSIRLYENLDLINDGAIVVLWGDDYYGGTKAALGGDSTGNSNIFLVGYILKGTIHYNYAYSYVDFRVGSITEQMKICEGFSVSVEDTASPTTWFQLQDMTVDRAIYHYLKWHSTILSITDFIYTGDGSQRVQYFDSDRGSLFDAIDNFLRSGVVGQITSNRQGRIYGEVNVEAVHNATGTFSPIMTLDKRDWINEPVINESLSTQVSYLEMGGIAYGSATGSANYGALLACAPGDAPFYRGKASRMSGLILDSQTHLNNLVGDVIANRNSKYPTIEVPLAGSYKNLDIAPQEAVRVIINAEDTVRGVAIDSPYVSNGLSYTYDHKIGLLLANTTLGVVTSGKAGKTIEIPVIPDDGGYGNINIGAISPIAIAPISFGTAPGHIFGTWSCELDGTDNAVLDVTRHTLPAAWTWTQSVPSSSPFWMSKWEFSSSVSGGGPGLIIKQSGWYRVIYDGSAYIEAAGTGPWTMTISYNPPGDIPVQSTDLTAYAALPDSTKISANRIIYFYNGDKILLGAEFPNHSGLDFDIRLFVYLSLEFLG